VKKVSFQDLTPSGPKRKAGTLRSVPASGRAV
jgi:hypothetical protein